MLTDERLAYWYLRLNGFLALANVMIHPEVGKNPRGEIDVLGVRFPHRSELLVNSMQDDPRFTADDKPLIVLGEVAQGRAKVNRTWLAPEARNMERILRLVGAFPLQRVGEIAATLYEQGTYTDENYDLVVTAFGASPNPVLAQDLPQVPQITWREVATFIYERFHQHRNAKHYHAQWDEAGHELWDLYIQHRSNPEAFYGALVERCGLREAA